MITAIPNIRDHLLPNEQSTSKPQNLGILQEIRAKSHAQEKKAIPPKAEAQQKEQAEMKAKRLEDESPVAQVKNGKHFYPYADGFGYWGN